MLLSRAVAWAEIAMWSPGRWEAWVWYYCTASANLRFHMGMHWSPITCTSKRLQRNIPVCWPSARTCRLTIGTKGARAGKADEQDKVMERPCSTTPLGNRTGTAKLHRIQRCPASWVGSTAVLKLALFSYVWRDVWWSLFASLKSPATQHSVSFHPTQSAARSHSASVSVASGPCHWAADQACQWAWPWPLGCLHSLGRCGWALWPLGRQPLARHGLLPAQLWPLRMGAVAIGAPLTVWPLGHH